GGDGRLAAGNYGTLDGALLQVIQHLVAGYAARPGDSQQLGHVVLIEVAHAPGEDFSRLPQRFETGDRLGQRLAAAPVQQIAVQPVGLQPFQRLLAGADRAGARGILRQYLGDEEQSVPLGRRERLGDDALGPAGAVHLGGVDMGHAGGDAGAQGRDGRAAVAVLDVPAALADPRDRPFRVAEGTLLHAASCQDLSSTCRTVVASSAKVKGLVIRCTPGSSLPSWTMALRA